MRSSSAWRCKQDTPASKTSASSTSSSLAMGETSTSSVSSSLEPVSLPNLAKGAGHGQDQRALAMGETNTSHASSSPGANCLGSRLQWQLGGARAQWLWSSAAGDTDVDADADADFDDVDEDLFWPLVMTKMMVMMMMMLVSGWSMKRWRQDYNSQFSRLFESFCRLQHITRYHAAARRVQ